MQTASAIFLTQITMSISYGANHVYEYIYAYIYIYIYIYM